jgi:hypothetical protein
MTRNPHNVKKEKKRQGVSVLPEHYLRDAALPASRDPREFDILTIRNRWYSRIVTLKTVIEAVRRLPHKYDEIHCSFCRSA